MSLLKFLLVSLSYSRPSNMTSATLPLIVKSDDQHSDGNHVYLAKQTSDVNEGYHTRRRAIVTVR